MRLAELASVQDYEYFVGNDLFRQRQKRDFLADKIRNPRLDYPQIDAVKIKTKMAGLEKLKVEIGTKENNRLVRQAYTDKIEEKTNELMLVLCSREISRSKDETNIKKHSRHFQRLTESLYGKPMPGIFNYALKNLRTKIVRNINHHNFIIGQASEELLSRLPMPDEKFTKKFGFWKNKRNLSRVKKMLMEEISLLLELRDEDKNFAPAEIKEFFENKIKQLGFNEWAVKIDANYRTISVDQKNKSIYVPKDREIDAASLEKLVLHEIGVHVLRRENGERSKLKLLGLGLDHYEIGEEGLASLVEGFFEDKINFGFFNLLSYVAIGMVYGVDGQRRDFRDLYEILIKLYLYMGLAANPDKSIEDIKQKAVNNAYNRCVRIFRGTSCQVSGVCFTRDMIYLKGKICMWDVINNNPQELKRVYCGKYNPCNDRHIQLLDDLGIQ